MTAMAGSVIPILTVVSAVFFVSVHGAFEGYQLLSITTTTREHVSFLAELADNYVDIDLWHDPAPNRTVQAALPPGLVTMVTGSLTKAGIKWDVLAADLTEMVRTSMVKQLRPMFHGRLGAMDIVDHYNYHDYGKIESYLYDLRTKYPDNLDLSYLDYVTHEGRQVIMVKLHGSAGTNKPAILGEAGIHAREWATPASTLYVIEKLMQRYQSEETTARSMLDKYDWYFIPVTNPDGYDYTHLNDNNRLWRKNRRQISNRCVGVDLNRNFDVEFGTTGVSSRCDSDIYPGTHGFSEPETANVRNLFNTLRNNLVGYLSIHAYSQLLLVPWGYSTSSQRPASYKELDRVANLMSAAIKASDGQTYFVGTAYQLLNYAASGASEDWALTEMPSLYAYCYELRPSYNDLRGFLLPPNEIVPTGQELLDSLAVLADEMQV